MAEISGSSDAETMAAVMALSLDAIVTKTRQGMITGWNPVAVEMYGYRPEEIIGHDSTVLVPAGWEGEEANLVRRAVAGEQVAPHPTNRVRKDGTILSVLLAMAAIRDPSAPSSAWPRPRGCYRPARRPPPTCWCPRRTASGCGPRWSRRSAWRDSGSSPAGWRTTSTT